MKGIMFIFGLIGILVMGANGKSDVTQLRLVTAQYQRLDAAQAAGYDHASALNSCVSNSALGGLGYRFVKPGLLDAQVDLNKPEAMVYVPGPNGALQLGAVEFIVPVEAWNSTHTGWPQLMGHQFHLNSALNVYVLHIWVWQNNPSGMFEDWNPNIACA